MDFCHIVAISPIIYYDEFKSLGIDPDLAISCVSTMFPVFANDVNEYQYGYQPVLNIRSKMRIAYEGRFELYFMFDLDDIKVSRSVINACIYKFDRDVLSKAVEKINEGRKYCLFFRRNKVVS